MSYAVLGYSLIELVFVMATMTTVGSMAVPEMLASLDDHRTLGAVRYLSGRIQRTRMEAVMRSTEVALKFTKADTDYAYTVYVDGNHDGVRTADIKRGTDRPLGKPEMLSEQFTGVQVGVLPSLPPVDDGSPPGNDPVKLGESDLLSFSANGTSSSGSVYVRGRRAQYVIRIYGVTAKTRILKIFGQLERLEATMTARHPERRESRRREGVKEHGIIRARVRPGKHISILNVSAGGALVETDHRLLPGTSVEMHVETDNHRAAIRGRVLRCNVSQVRPIALSYRGAITFESHLPWFQDDETAGYSLHMPEVRSGRHRGPNATRQVL